MAFVVLYDACVLYPAPLRDLLVRLANAGVVRARWSETILDECFRNILLQRPDLRPEALARTRELMRRAVPDSIVTGFEGSSRAWSCPTLMTVTFAPGAMTNVVAAQAAALKSPPRSIGELLDTLREQGLVRSVAKLRGLFGGRRLLTLTGEVAGSSGFAVRGVVLVKTARFLKGRGWRLPSRARSRTRWAKGCKVHDEIVKRAN